MVVLSIDLAASQHKRTGLAYFNDHTIVCESVKTDEEILKRASEHDVVGIDAMLTLPHNRSDVEHGTVHERQCDKQLRRMGIKFFNLGFKPMQQLTRRALQIKEQLEDMGITVHEVYPGASLDILGLKRKNVESVKQFLSPFNAQPTNVDESDAAIGLFTLWTHELGLGRKVEGHDGTILLPPPTHSFGNTQIYHITRRQNRFTVLTQEGPTLYIRDTGRHTSLLLHNNRVKYSTTYNVIKAMKDEKYWVSVDPFADTPLVRAQLLFEGIKTQTKGVKVGHTIFDFKFDDKYGEVKGVSWRQGNSALFPDGKSQRAIRQARVISKLGGMFVFVAHFPAANVHIVDPELSQALDNVHLRAYNTVIVHDFLFLKQRIHVFK